MKTILCGSVLCTVLIGGFAFPTDLNAVKNPEKQEKQSSLFGIGFDYNLSKNSSLIPIPTFLNAQGNYETGAGAGGNIVVPMIFPLGLFLPSLNLSLAANANKNVSFGVSAQPNVPEIDVGWSADVSGGWNAGWTTTTPGWGSGWTTTTQGWGWPSTTTPPPTTTQGWGWPSTTTAPPTTTQGWGWPSTTTAPPTTTSGWGWSTTAPPPPPPPGWKSPESEKLAEKVLEIRRGPPANIGPSRPVPNAADKPKPQGVPAPKPNPQPQPMNTESSPNMPDKGSDSQSYIVDVAQSSLSSELPAQSEQALAAAAAAQANAHLENELQSDSHPYFSIMEVDGSSVFVPEVVAQDTIPSAESPSSGESSEEAAELVVQNSPVNQPSVRISVPIAPLVASVASKSRRHAGVEIPAALRIEDFEDVEVANEQSIPENPAAQDPVAPQEGDEMSKEEMILLAMEQLSTQLPPGVQLNMGRPSGSRPHLLNSNSAQSHHTSQSTNSNKPASQIPEPAPVESQDFSSEEDSSEEAPEEESDADTKNIEMEPTSEVSKTIPKAPEAAAPEKPSRNKPRPYGMDRPSKNKPHSEGHKSEHFGLPHLTDLQQKEQEGEMASTTVMGFQIPLMKWSSFSDIFQHFMGSRHKKTGMAKSDDAVIPTASEEKCVDDEVENDSTRTQVIHAGSLCTNNERLVKCNEACRSKGFSSGTCLGPASTPGCLCKLPNHKEYGMMLNPLKSEESREQDLQQSGAPACKKCDCEDSCKKAGSFTGFCVGKCYCANPWYTKL